VGVKVCFLTSNFPPEIQAGTEMVAQALGEALLAQGHEVLVVSTSERLHAGTDVRSEQLNGLRVLRVFKKPDEWDAAGLHRPRLLQLVEGILQRERPDVLHAHHLAGFGGGQLQQAQRLGIPGVLTFHDVWVTCARYFRMPPPGFTCPEAAGREECVGCVNEALGHSDLTVVREALMGRDREVIAEVRAAAVLTAPSRTAAAMVQEHLPWQGPVAVIPHGLLRPVAAGERGRGPRPGEALRVGTFGNLTEPKGVLDLVRVMAGIDAELHLHGPFLEPAFQGAVQAEAARLRVRLSLHGPYLPGTPHPAGNLHLAVFPSRCQETYGLVIDEALARGVPVVVSDLGAFAERRGQGGVVVTSLLELGDCLRALVARERLRALAAAIPSELPTVAAAAAEYLAIYRRLAR
jgi:glycosyltransferase involved in cell wall biosynthesis